MTSIVCLSRSYDLKGEFAGAFQSVAPGVRLLRPDEVEDRSSVRVAFAHDPAPGAFDPYPGLELVCSWGAGVDRLAAHPGLGPQITLCRMIDPGQAEMMAAFAAYYVTAWHRGMFDYPAQQASRLWRQVNWTPNADMPVAVLGYGKMGAAIGRGLCALGYPVRGWAGTGRVVDGVEVLAGRDGFEDLLRSSAAVINVLPLTEATEGIIDANAFSLMRSDAILIHLGRGAQLVEDDLIAALDAGRPGLAALDVFAREPLPETHPFWAHPKVRVTPHAASTASNTAVARSVAQAVTDYLAGRRPAGIVDRERGY